MPAHHSALCNCIKYSTVQFVNVNINKMAKIVVVENELENKQEKNVVVPRSAAEIQRFKLEKLLKKAVRVYVDDFST